MREFVGTQCLEQLKWSSDNVDQLVGWWVVEEWVVCVDIS